MSEFNFNGLEDLEIDTTQTTFGKLVLGVMLAVFALASMVTTFSFFVTYAPKLGEAIHPTFGAYIAGALGVVLFDLAGLGWTVLRARNSDTTKQFVIATGAAVITIGLALLASALQVLLSSSFDVGLYAPEGGLSAFGRSMQLVGVIVMTAGFVVNFAAITAYVNTSKDVTRAVQNTQLKAYVTGGRFAADQARAQMVTRQTLAGIMSQLPSLAAQAGQENSSGYVNRAFAGMRVVDAQTLEAMPQAVPTSPDTPHLAQEDDSLTYDLDDLVNALVDERLRQREAEAAVLTVNGNGANFTKPANSRGS